jgi:pilus assembly protein CpaC
VHAPQRFAIALLATALALPATWSPPSAFELIAPQTERSISVVIGAGQLIRVDSEFASLFVANPDVADIEVKSPRLLYLTGVGVGETTLFALDENDTVLMSANITVTHNTSALQRGIARVAPGTGVTATTVDQSLVLTGEVATPEIAANVVQVASQFVDDPSRVVNRMTIASPIQVNLQVRIAEIKRNVDRQLGIRWNEIGYSDGNINIGFVGGRRIAGGYDTSINYATSSFNVDVVLQALSDEGLVSILAEPNLTARSGENARFLAGGEFPYPVAQEGGVNTVEFKEFGVGLTFTPVVLDNNNISLRVATEVSDLSRVERAGDVPALSSRRAETTVDLASGQSFAIAGLMQNNSTQTSSSLPGLSTLPVIGSLFRSTGFLRGQTELVIIVTPVIVQPASARALRTPLDTFVPPNDFERILYGRFQGDPQRVNQVQNRIGSRRLNGASGFVFE